MALRYALLAAAIFLGASFAAYGQSAVPGIPIINNKAASSTNPVPEKSGQYQSAGPGTSQFNLAVGTGTTLTVPNGANCAFITVEGGTGASVRRTSDGTAPTTSVGTLIGVGTQWADCGPLAAYQFTASSGSPTLDVEYFQ